MTNRENSPRALRSSSKFSELFIFQDPEKSANVCSVLASMFLRIVPFRPLFWTAVLLSSTDVQQSLSLSLSLSQVCECALSSRPIRSICACAASHWASATRAPCASSKDSERALFAPPFGLSDRVIYCWFRCILTRVICHLAGAFIQRNLQHDFYKSTVQTPCSWIKHQSHLNRFSLWTSVVTFSNI